MHSWLKVPFYLALGRVHKQQHCFSQKELIIEINYCFFQTTAISPQCLDVKNSFLACCFYEGQIKLIKKPQVSGMISTPSIPTEFFGF